MRRGDRIPPSRLPRQKRQTPNGVPSFAKPGWFSRGRGASVVLPVTKSPPTSPAIGALLATHGSDLYLLGDRMRPEFFSRWTRSPLRIIPGMEMPSFERPIAGILEGHLDRQLAALWEAFNDKSGPPKIDTSTIEQFLAFAPGEPVKVIRDVFAVGNPLAPQFIPRAFAVGFKDGVNVLFDLDAMTVRGDWLGGFARQRSSGKSWFWEPAGNFRPWSVEEIPDISLRKAGDAKGPLIVAQKESGRFGRLRKYGPNPEADKPSRSVSLQYALEFELPSTSATVEVTETYDAVASPGSAACQRFIRVSGVPDGYEAVLREPVSVTGDASQAPPAGRENRLRPLALDSDGRLVALVCYGGRTPPREPPPPASPTLVPQIERVTAVPGYDGVRLPLLQPDHADGHYLDG